MNAVQFPVEAREWSCNAPTTIVDARGVVVAECSGFGRHSDIDTVAAAEIVRRLNLHDRLLEALTTLADRNATIYAHEVTLPMKSHAAAMRALRAAREVIADATRGAA